MTKSVWRDVVANLGAFLAAQGLGAVEVVHGLEPPQQKAPFGKFRQVIGATGQAAVRPA